ncbi:hypothetical protein ACIRYZ_38810 [Kitasatospora sp. NPDC101155]|uniref:hypothetical protein n=1 Tax=Kitasatospora sp. NPDC101155 TaxID=3364097 RepID=UPI00380AA6B9
MSWLASEWAAGDAPIANVNEYAVLTCMAETAGRDGCASYQSGPTIAARTTLSERTVTRAWKSMEERGLIAKGDQSIVEKNPKIRPDKRPIVWDLLIPYSWFPNIDKINAEREQFGRDPLTPENRPDLDEAPSKKARVDKGVKRPKKGTGTERGVSESPRPGTPDEDHGVTTSPERGDYKSETGCLVVTQISQENQVKESLSPAPQVTGTSETPAEAGTEERETEASPEDKPTPPAAPVAPAQPEEVPALGLELTAEQGRVVQELFTAWMTARMTSGNGRHSRGPVAEQQFRESAAGLVTSERFQQDWLIELAEWMAAEQPTWANLANATTAQSMGAPAQRRVLPTQRTGPVGCPACDPFSPGWHTTEDETGKETTGRCPTVAVPAFA